MDRARLRRAIGGRTWQAAIAHERGVDRDLARSTRDHARLDREEALGDAQQIDADHRLDGLDIDGLALPRGDAGIQEGQGDRPMDALDRIGDVPHPLRIGDVAGMGDDAAGQVLGAAGKTLQRLQPPGRDRDRPPPPRQFERDRGADAGACAGDPGDAVLRLHSG